MSVFGEVRRPAAPVVVTERAIVRPVAKAGPLKAQMVVDVGFTLNCLRATGGVATALEIAENLGLPKQVDLVSEILERMVLDGMAERIDGATGPARYRRHA